MGGSGTMPDLAALALFVDTVRLGSISQAAKAASISQPAASMKLRHLESRLGLPLLERHVTGCAPTAAGQLLYEHGCRVLAQVDTLTQAMAEMRSPAPANVLRIATSYTMAEYVLPRALTNLCRAMPEAEFAIRVYPSQEVVRLLDEGAVDLGFIESLNVPPGVSSTLVLRDRLVLVVGASHPWARHGRGVTAETLARTPLVMRAAGTGTLGRLLGRHGLDLAPPKVELGSDSAVKSAVADGVGAAVASVLAVQADIAAGRLVPVAVTGLDLGRELRAVWRAGQATTLGTRFVNVLVKQVKMLDLASEVGRGGSPLPEP